MTLELNALNLCAELISKEKLPKKVLNTSREVRTCTRVILIGYARLSWHLKMSSFLPLPLLCEILLVPLSPLVCRPGVVADREKACAVHVCDDRKHRQWLQIDLYC